MSKVSKDKDNKKNEVFKSENGKEIFSRDAIKQRGLGRFFKSFTYSVQGLAYAYKYEQSMLIHVIFTILVIAINILFKITGTEWLISMMAIGMVLAAELINTAIEAAVDLTTMEIHPLAKIAKDCASAATFVLAMMAFAIGITIYLPYFLKVLGWQ